MTRFFEIVQRPSFRYRSLTRIVHPVVEPVSLSELKGHLRIDQDFTDDDLFLQGLISAGRMHVENASSRTLIRSKWRMKLDVFPAWNVELPNPPVMSDPVEVTYVPSDGVFNPVSFSNFRTDRDAIQPVIRPQWNGFWPTVRGAENDVTVSYWAGYGDSPHHVPAPARHCILLLAAHWFSNREAVVPGGMNPVPMAVELMLGAISWGQYR